MRKTQLMFKPINKREKLKKVDLKYKLIELSLKSVNFYNT